VADIPQRFLERTYGEWVTSWSGFYIGRIDRVALLERLAVAYGFALAALRGFGRGAPPHAYAHAATLAAECGWPLESRRIARAGLRLHPAPPGIRWWPLRDLASCYVPPSHGPTGGSGKGGAG
jgi:hypothetical protein